MKRLSVVLFSFFCLYSTYALAAEEPAQEVLTIGYTGSYQPLNFMVSGQFSGLDRQILQALASKMNVRLKFIRVPLTELWQALEEGTIDIASGGLSVTQGRSERVIFTDPYLITGQVPIIRYSDAKRFNHKRALFRADVKVGAIMGTSAVDLINSQFPKSLLQLYSSQAQVIEGLRKKHIDFYIHDEPTAWLIASSQEFRDLTSTFYQLNAEPLAFAVSKTNQPLAIRINRSLSEISESGLIEQFQSQWLPATLR